MNGLPRVAITIGDPAGIGPEIALKALAEPAVRASCVPVLIGPRSLLATVAARLSLSLPEHICDIASTAEIIPGRISAAAGAVAAAAIEEAIAGTRAGRYAALVTNPIHKQAIHAAGVPFPGHTEWLAARCGVRGETMLMYHDELAVALATCHLPLQAVPAALSPQRLIGVGRLLHAALRRIRGKAPRLAICGFNPHAGEGGLFGHEDEVVVPAVYELLQLGIDCEGPLPPDTAFTPAARKRYDGIIALYHDQGLIPFKALHFDTGVNVTMGLPIVRTSVDHGTAFDIAWQGVAQHTSLVSAIALAARLSHP
jgi:4-phospho-D-threonate 3-dehydrogenase / 4-phospho-D-erythronate 3-dehydrogenase